MTITDRVLTRGPAVYVLWKQSNALGREVVPTSPPVSLPRSDIRYLYEDIAFGIALDQMDLQSLATARWTGCELSLGVELVDTYGLDVAIAKIARGSTGFIQWDCDDTSKNMSILYRDVRRFIETLRRKSGRDPYVAGMIHVGGEQEALSTAEATTYAADMNRHFASARANFGPQLPHWIVGLQEHVGGRADSDVALVRAGEAAVAAADARATLIDTSDLAREGDNVHYTIDAQVDVLGPRLAASIASVGEYHPVDDPGAVRVSLYPTLSRAQSASRFLGYTPVRVAPVDTLWAVEDRFGPHWIARNEWAEV